MHIMRHLLVQSKKILCCLASGIYCTYIQCSLDKIFILRDLFSKHHLWFLWISFLVFSGLVTKDACLIYFNPERQVIFSVSVMKYSKLVFQKFSVLWIKGEKSQSHKMSQKPVVLFTQSKSLTFPSSIQLAELDTIVANVGWTTFIWHFRLVWLTVSVKVCFHCFSMEKASNPSCKLKTYKASVWHKERRKTKRKKSYRRRRLGIEMKYSIVHSYRKIYEIREELLMFPKTKKSPFCEMIGDGTMYPRAVCPWTFRLGFLNASFGWCIPWTMRPLVERFPWTMRPSDDASLNDVSRPFGTDWPIAG